MNPACFFILLLIMPALGWPLSRPNILIIVGDDWGGPYASAYTGIYGRALPGDIVKTPNLDRIADNGVIFKNAYVNAPSCTAARSSILSGRYFFNTHGGAILGGHWDFSIPTFPQLMYDAGYHVGKSYKGWSPGIPIDAPFGHDMRQYQQAGSAARNFSSNVTLYRERGMSLERAKYRVFTEVKENFEDFLADRKAGQPFLYWFGPTNTHRSWVKGSGKALWGIKPDQLKGKLHAFLPDVYKIREDMADYLGEIQALDAYVGVLLQKLEEIGELDNTLIVATGDNGPGGFPHGKWNLYDFGVATPLLMWLPGGKGGRVVEDFTTLMDLAPTFLQLAGASRPVKMDGKSLLPILRSPKSGQIDPERNFAITGEERHNAYARSDGLPYPARALRTKTYLYIKNFAPERWPMGCPLAYFPNDPDPRIFPDIGPTPSPSYEWVINNRFVSKSYFTLSFGKRPADELYDLRNDPDQIHNVADDPAYAAIKDTLTQRLLSELTRVGDPRVTGDGDMFDRPPYTHNPKVICKNWVPSGWATMIQKTSD